eukprot:TRINITY_DN2346_c0_g1_i3.p1 TRINITY_DN2346_c0_g1~~TRINITY_DN2346_c0_g1_i3.p1  ORF type:complete len:268 (-),score=42.44 TRINITY_DN2346_c0_g1_i3:516-1319(-)
MAAASSSIITRNTITFLNKSKPKIYSSSSSLHFPSPCLFILNSFNPKRISRVSAIAAAEEQAVAEDIKDDSSDESPNLGLQRCDLYVCNLPRSCDIAELLELFKPYGTVQSVEVSRNSETGISRGCGYVTMGSIPEAKAAVAALDKSDLGGREIRVTFPTDMITGRKALHSLNVAPKKNVVFESPYKIYVGNLAWSVKPEDLRDHFSQFGTVVSTKVLYDHKAGKNRAYGFLSFSSEAELEAALSSSRVEFHGRTLLVREVVRRYQT